MEPPGVEKVSIFEAQDIIESEEEPVDICSTGDGFVVAIREGKIFAYCLLMKYVLVHSFSTVYSCIEQVEYLPHTDCIITRERDPARIIRSFAYFNWRQNFTEKNKVRTLTPAEIVVLKDPTVVMADNRHVMKFIAQELSYKRHHGSSADEKAKGSSGGKMGSSSVSAGDDGGRIEYGIHEVLGVCPSTSRVILSCGYALQLWDCSKCPANVLMEIVISSPAIDQVLLYGPFLAYTYEDTMRVYEFELTPIASTEARSVDDGENDVVDDPFCFDVFFDENGEATLQNSPAVLVKEEMEQLSKPVAGLLSSTTTASEYECLGPITDTDFGVNVLCGSYELKMCHLLIDRKFNVPLVNMTFSAIRDVGDVGKNSSSNSVSDINNSNDLLPRPGWVDFVVATQDTIYIYGLAKGKAEPISFYTSHNEINFCAVSHSLMYLLHANSLSIWTMHVPGSKSNCPIRICDLTFFSLRQIAFQEENVLLMSKYIDEEPGGDGGDPGTSWNLYALRARPFTSFIEEVLSRANLLSKNREEYINYIREILNFVAARVSEVSERKSIGAKDQVDFYNEQVELRSLTALMQRGAILLAAAYYEESRFTDAAKLYALSGVPLSSVFDLLKGGKGKYQNAMMRYLEDILFDERSIELMDASQTMGDSVIAFFRENSPKRLADVVLHSSLKAYSREKAIEMLRYEYETGNPNYTYTVEDKNRILFAIILISVDLGRNESAKTSLKELDDAVAFEFLYNVKDLVILASDEGGEGRERAKAVDEKQVLFRRILLETSPFVLLEALANYNDVRASLSGAQSIFNGAYEQGSEASTAREGGESHAEEPSLLLECYAEHFLSSYLSQLKEDSRQGYPFRANRDKYYRLLIDIYFRKAIGNEDAVSRGDRELIHAFKDGKFCNKWMEFHDSVFTPHKEYPFIEKPELSEEEGAYAMLKDPAGFYFQKLLMLVVSGLSSDHKALLERLEKVEDEGKQAAIQSICLAESGQVDLACDALIKYDVQLIPQFCELYCRSHTEWVYPLELLTNALSGEKSEFRDKCHKVYIRCLEHLVESTTPRQFLSLLPGDGSIAFFLDYIIRNANRHTADGLRVKISNQCVNAWMKDESQ